MSERLEDLNPLNNVSKKVGNPAGGSRAVGGTSSRHAALAATLRTAGNLRRFSPLSRSVMTPAAMIAVPAIALLWLAGFAEDAAGFVVSTSPSHAVATEAGRLHQRQLQPQQHRCCRQRARGLAETRMKTAADNVVGVKSKLLQLAAVMDRGGMANPGKRCC